MNKNTYMGFRVFFYLWCNYLPFPHNNSAIGNTGEPGVSGTLSGWRKAAHRDNRVRRHSVLMDPQLLRQTAASQAGRALSASLMRAQTELIISPSQLQGSLPWKFCTTQKGDLGSLTWIFKKKVTPKGWKSQAHLFHSCPVYVKGVQWGLCEVIDVTVQSKLYNHIQSWAQM